MTPESLFSLTEWAMIFEAVYVRLTGLQVDRTELTEKDRQIDDTYAEILAVIREQMAKLS